MTPVPIFVDRSRMQEAHNCMRLRWWRYHFAGRGLEPRAASLALLEGGIIHRGIELLLGGGDIESIIAEVLPDFVAELRARGTSSGAADDLFVLEQSCLLECLLRAWDQVRLGEIKAEFEVVRVEPEIRWVMDAGPPEMIDLVRPDTILRRRLDSRLFYREWKTTSSGGEDWAAGWEHTSQALANIAALQDTLKERIWGMQVEGFVKGRRDREKRKTSKFFGQPIQQSWLCYAWKKNGALAPDWAYGAEHVRVWEETTPAAWIAAQTPEKLASLFVHVMPVVPAEDRMASWRRQEVAKERRIAVAVTRLGPFPAEKDLDEEFPQNEDHCLRYWGHPCAFEAACFTARVRRDPVGSGLYALRVPHHRAEREKFSLDSAAAAR